MRNLFCVLSAVLGLGLAARAGEPKVTGIKASCRDGQVFVTWKDVAEGQAGAAYRYSVYRSEKPITQANVTVAKPVIRGILNNSCKLMGGAFRLRDRLDPKKPCARLVARGETRPLWSGVGVHTVTKPGKGYYAVVATDLKLNPVSKVVPGKSATTAPVDEKVAPVQPIRQLAADERLNKASKIASKKGLPLWVTLHASCGSSSKLPRLSNYFLYFAPEKELGWRAGQPGAFSLWEGGRERPRLNLLPRDTMTTPGGRVGRENLWFGLFCRPNWSRDSEPRAYPFAERRVEWIIDWVVKKYGVDANRICMGGQSMGAWGAMTIGLRRPRIFAAIYPTGPKCHQWALPNLVGGKIYLKTPTRKKVLNSGSMRVLKGKKPMMPDGKTEFFDYLDMIKFVEDTPASVDLPFACFIGGRLGGRPGAGYAKWPNMVAMVKAFSKNHHGFGFGWDNKGHGSARTQFKLLCKYYPWHRFSLKESYPAFGNSSIDDDIGPEGPKEGYINVGFVWKEVVDEAGKWSAKISNGEAKGDMTADVTPRRCQKFKAKPGEKLKWTSSAGGAGTVTADKWGLVTVEKVKIPHGKEVTLTVTR